MSTMHGIYKFYQNGELVGEAKNSLTETGRILAIKTLMGAIPSFANSISVGVSSTANQAAVNGLIPDTDLSFRTSSTVVYGSNLDPTVTNDALVFKGKISDPLSYRIWEVGLFADPLVNGEKTYRDEVLLAFESSDFLKRTVSGTTYLLTDPAYLALTPTTKLIPYSTSGDGSLFRIGDYGLYLTAGQTVFTNNVFTGLDTFDSKDLLKIAYYAKGTVSGTVSVTFTDISGSTKTYQFTESSLSAKYNVQSLAIDSPTSSTGTGFNWANISQITLTCASRDFILDGLKLERVNKIPVNYGMLSRAVLVSPITKLSNVPLDIEYYLTLGFNV